MFHQKFKILYLFLPLLFFTYPLNSDASYVSYTNTYTVGSVPIDSNSFYYSDGRGNYISIRQSTNIPVIINQYHQGSWISINNNRIPNQAIVIQYINGYPVYACRIYYQNRILYGQLIPYQGCYIQNLSPQPFNSYQILVR